MDAQSLFREGVLALREKKDAALAGKLLAQSLKLDPQNEMAWLWLARTTNDPRKKMQCVERALKLNPQNETALRLRDQLTAAEASQANLHVPAFSEPLEPAPHSAFAELQPVPPIAYKVKEVAAPPPRAPGDPPTPVEQRQIAALLAEADELLQAEDVEGAIEKWVGVLDIQSDHPAAMQNAVRQLFKLNYKDDAKDLIWIALEDGTTSIPIHMTAIDIARVQGDDDQADNLRERVVLLPGADEDLAIKMVDHFLDKGQPNRAADLLDRVLALHPNNARLLMKMGDIQDKALGDHAEAMLYYESAAHTKGSGANSTASKAAAKIAAKSIRDFPPVMTDRERGSLPLALREAFGFGAAFLLLGWQDAGLNLARMGAQRWIGVGLSVFGGYLLVTALSAPQQKPLAALLRRQSARSAAAEARIRAGYSA